MDNELKKKENLFSLTQEKIGTDTIRILLKMFSFNIPEEQLPYIKINSLKKYRISFINNFTNEKCVAYYTSECPPYAGNCRFTGEAERFLGQKIVDADSTIKINWFYVQGDRIIYDDYSIKPIYIPPYERNLVPIIEQAIFSGKSSDGNFVLRIQKDYPTSNETKNLEVEIFKGTFDEVYPRQFGDVLEPSSKREIIRIKYGLNEDYNYFETGSLLNRGRLNETRYIYGRNMLKLTDYEYAPNTLVDNRLIYGVAHDQSDNIKYYGIILEDGSNLLKKIQPIGITHLTPLLQAIEDSKEKPISKIYFRGGYDRTTGHKYLGILKTKKGINIIRDETRYGENDNSRKRIGCQKVNQDFFDSISDGSISVNEIEKAINILNKKYPEDTFVQAVCNELEIFIERKMERKELSEMDFQVSDICIPNLTVHFDTDIIVNMLKKQGISNSISKIIESYSNMFRNDKQAVINCNR